ncbi:MAG: tetratricopeptide repeat protein [Planctomycetota bacterium]
MLDRRVCRRLFTAALGSCLASLVGCASLGSPAATPPWYQIGEVHRRVSTDSSEAQLWFDRGLALTYGFNHEEAIRCFEHAAAADPACAMAYWGKAYALGPHYNNPVCEPLVATAAVAALAQARQHLARCSDVERDLIAALLFRYEGEIGADRAALDLAYANAMRQVLHSHPDDADVAALTGEALLQLRPWKLWSPQGEAAPETPEIVALLEDSLARWPNHPALCHLYIHTVEASPNPERALAVAERLENLVPGAGHLVHMPSHIYTWTGRYADVIRVNEQAVAMDRAFVEHAGRHNFFTFYRLHNLHFIAYGAMFDGRRELAMSAAREVVAEIPAELLVEMADFLDIFVATPYHVMVRFGMWNEILAEPEPAPELLAARTVWHYARGVAFASLGNVAAAETEYQAFLRAQAAVPATRMLFQNPVSLVLQVAEVFLAGEIEYRRGNYDRAFQLLREAVARDERMNYDEPWGWMEPTRHALGALLIERGHLTEAETVYREDLERYPENGWSLHGLAECLRRTGRTAEAAAMQTRFERAWERADVVIPGSCYCRTI